MVRAGMGVGRRHLAGSVCSGAGQMQGRFGMRGRVAGPGRGGFFCPAGLNRDTVPAVAGAWQHLFNTPLFSCCKSVLPGRSSWQVERGRRRGGCSWRGFQAARMQKRLGPVASPFLGRQELLSEKQSGCAGMEVSQGPSACGSHSTTGPIVLGGVCGAELDPAGSWVLGQKFRERL